MSEFKIHPPTTLGCPDFHYAGIWFVDTTEIYYKETNEISYREDINFDLVFEIVTGDGDIFGTGIYISIYLADRLSIYFPEI